MKKLLIIFSLLGLTKFDVLSIHTEAIPKGHLYLDTYIAKEGKNIIRIHFKDGQCYKVDTINFIPTKKK